MPEVEHTLLFMFSSTGASGKNFKSTESLTRPAVSSVLSFNSSNLQVIVIVMKKMDMSIDLITEIIIIIVYRNQRG